MIYIEAQIISLIIDKLSVWSFLKHLLLLEMEGGIFCLVPLPWVKPCQDLIETTALSCSRDAMVFLSVSAPHFVGWNLTARMMLFAGGALGRWLGSEDAV